MITSEHRKKITQTLGTNLRYTTKVSKILLQKETLNEHTQKPYSAATIRNVFNGLHENRGIELAIMEWFNLEKAHKDELKDLMNETFSSSEKHKH